MCGRFGLITTPDATAEVFDLTAIDSFPPRYNIAPSQPILMVINASELTGGGEGRTAMLARWGLIPAWVKDGRDFPLLFNARSESAAEKPAFRGAMRHFRALVPASGFFEWRRTGGRDTAQPYWIRPRHGGLIALAGLMSPWQGADGTELDTGTILTTAASGVVAKLHERSPVVIMPDDFERWLDCRTLEPRHVADLLRPPPDDFFEAFPVSKAVSNARNLGADLIAPIGPALLPDAPEAGSDAQMDLF
ncbi:SOS response-associated peptidase [Martelella mangrovi]|uniref:Abasic site processing protein n=1 Tax=Martelella mangrovi TaxID=1397477 RepID=A0ABV2I9H0_9HYPH